MSVHTGSVIPTNDGLLRIPTTAYTDATGAVRRQTMNDPVDVLMILAIVSLVSWGWLTVFKMMGWL